MATENITLQVTTTKAFSGGVAPVEGTGKHRRYIVSNDAAKGYGAWQAGEQLTLTVDTNETVYDLANNSVNRVEPTYVETIDQKVYVCAGNTIYFSGINSPLGWENRFPGFGYITLEAQKGADTTIRSIGKFTKKLVILCDNQIQLWDYDPDPQLYRQAQMLNNTGTNAKNTLISYGDLDAFYSSGSGVRSIRPRQFTDLVNVADVGSPIDGLPTGSDSAWAAYTLSDGRYFLYDSGVVYMFSYFPESKVSAWSTYSPQGASGISTFTHGVIRANRLWLRDTDDGAAQIYLYPTTTYSGPTTVVIPFVDAKTPATRKQWTGVDFFGTGTWSIYAGDDLTDETSFSTVATGVTFPTAGDGRIPMSFIGTHLVIKLTSTDNNIATLSSAVAHYELLDSKA